ncbi:DUF4262 domain-containing protein [Flammeovirga agarivorans]|uniref:DUF4262 domain-containing protein n=1 Tax=Flammeovirga agarivorans TaxID=2726742 RepID=A0A7X8SKY2_9BACT|nr:DUF4262 domain-containing protein [Flammeovirga agarivorans]NLR92129.1 DUF4262 domain-containing protein [Flammeovirga agarivorans]
MDLNNQFDAELGDDILENIKENGYHIGVIEGDDYLPAFAFSIGLYKSYQHPEIIVFGLPMEMMKVTINTLCDAVKKGTKYKANTEYNDILNKFPVKFLEVNKAYYSDYLRYNSWVYDHSNNFPAVQLVWTDNKGNFPWDTGFNSKWKFNQPLLDRNIDFKFYEDKDLEVYTTKYTFKGNPIRWVYHTKDGGWEFHSEEHPDFEDAQSIRLSELIKMDPTLNQLFELNYGKFATRKDLNSPWGIYDHNEEDE